MPTVFVNGLPLFSVNPGIPKSILDSILTPPESGHVETTMPPSALGDEGRPVGYLGLSFTWDRDVTDEGEFVATVRRSAPGQPTEEQRHDGPRAIASLAGTRLWQMLWN